MSKVNQTNDQSEEKTPQRIVKRHNFFSQKKDSLNDNSQEFNALKQRIFIVQAKLQSQKRGDIKMVIIFILLLFIGFFIITYQEFIEIKNYAKQLEQLQSKSQEQQKEIYHLQTIINSLRQEYDSIYRYTEKLANQIVDIYENQLSKTEKSMLFIQKYSNPLEITFNKKRKSFKENYKLYNNDGIKLKKITHEEVIAYNENPIPQNEISFFKIRVDQTQLGMISIGVFTQEKLNANIDCGYCLSTEMYYFYCTNGQIYHGETLLFKNSKKSRFTKIQSGDIITLFIDREQHQLIWYVNGKYAQSQYIEDKRKNLYPFILMTTRGDQVTILT